MSRHRNESPREQWNEGLNRLEALTKQFQRELGKLQQVAELGAGDHGPVVELAATPEEPTNDDERGEDAGQSDR